MRKARRAKQRTRKQLAGIAKRAKKLRTQNVKMVVMDGKVIDIGFTKYKNPIPSFYSYQTLPLVLEITPLFLIEGSGPTVMKVRGGGG